MHCNQSPLISIIIPVYQVEKYLDKCIASVVNQTYTNLEIILVDDGSPDNCPAICDAWKERDPRIKVIHQENGGLSRARNEGLKIATGEFIGFVDSDDWIELNMYRILLDLIVEHDADIAICDSLNESEDSQVTIPISKQPVIKTYTVEEAMKMLLLCNNMIRINVWNKLYRKNILGNIQFPIGKIFEDVAWTPQIIGCAKKIILIDTPLYHYFSRPDSLCNNSENLCQKYKDSIELNEQRIHYYRNNYPSLEKQAIAKYQVDCCINYIIVSQYYRGADGDGSTRQIIHLSFCKWSWTINLALGNYKFGIVCFIFHFFPILLPCLYSIYDKLLK